MNPIQRNSTQAFTGNHWITVHLCSHHPYLQLFSLHKASLQKHRELYLQIDVKTAFWERHGWTMALFSLCLLAAGYMIYCPPFTPAVSLFYWNSFLMSLALSLFLTLLCQIHRVSGDEGIHEPDSGKEHEGCAIGQSWWEMQGTRFQAMTSCTICSHRDYHQQTSSNEHFLGTIVSHSHW